MRRLQMKSHSCTPSKSSNSNENGRNIQLADAIEIKQEGGIKHERVYVGELVASGHRKEGNATVSNECDAECDFEHFSSVDVEN